MNYSISGALLILTGFINLTFFTVIEFVHKRILQGEYSDLTSYNKMAFDDFTMLYIFMVLLIILGALMIIYDLYLHFKKNS